jgi:hypothetical protein
MHEFEDQQNEAHSAFKGGLSKEKMRIGGNLLEIKGDHSK